MLFMEDFNCVYFFYLCGLATGQWPVHSAQSLTPDCHARPGLHEGATVRQDLAGFIRLVTLVTLVTLVILISLATLVTLVTVASLVILVTLVTLVILGTLVTLVILLTLVILPSLVTENTKDIK